MDLVERYKTLPQAANIPDIIWDCQKSIDRMDELRVELNDLQDRYTLLIPKLIQILKEDWTDEELTQSGFLKSGLESE